MKSLSAGSASLSASHNRVAFAPGDSVADCDALLTHVAIIDKVLEDHASELGNDLVAYRNHVYRVVNLCVGMVGSGDALEKIATAPSSDVGIWTDRTFDYITPSIALARKYLVTHARQVWERIVQKIDQLFPTIR